HAHHRALSSAGLRTHGPGADLRRSEVLHPAFRFQDHPDVAPRHRRARVRLHGEPEKLSSSYTVVIISTSPLAGDRVSVPAFALRRGRPSRSSRSPAGGEVIDIHEIGVDPSPPPGVEASSQSNPASERPATPRVK